MISDKQLKQLTDTLKKQMPTFMKQDELNKLLDSAKAKYKNSGIYEKKHYASFKAFCAAIPDLLKGGYTIEPMKCSASPCSYTVALVKPLKVSNKELKDKLLQVESDYSEDTKIKESEWLDKALAEALESHQKAELDKIQQEQQRLKENLLQALRATISN